MLSGIRAARYVATILHASVRRPAMGKGQALDIQHKVRNWFPIAATIAVVPPVLSAMTAITAKTAMAAMGVAAKAVSATVTRAMALMKRRATVKATMKVRAATRM
jgi:hypothetical protein